MNRHASLMPTFAALAILILLFVGAQIYFGNFITPRNISSLLLDNAYLLILAVGMTFVILTGGIDLSVGSVMAFTGILCARLLSEGIPAFVTIPVMVLGGAAIGLMVGVLVQYFEVQPFIASLAGLFLARGLAFVVSLESIKVVDPVVLWLGSTRFRLGDWYISPTGILALLVVAIAAIVLQWTRFGRTIYAIGGNEQSARLMGLNVARTKVVAYVISGVCAGLAGLALTAYSGRGLPALRRRHRARCDRGRRDRRHAAQRRTGLRAGVDGRRLRLRRDPDRDLLHGRRAVLDAHHHRHPAAGVHRRAARDRRAFGSTPLRWSARGARRRDGIAP